MGTELRIKKLAQERGMTMVSIARKLGIHRSNMSAIASGARGISLHVLKKITRILDCSLDELIMSTEHPQIYKNEKMQAMLRAIEQKNADGTDKSWVSTIMFAGSQHYKSARRAF